MLSATPIFDELAEMVGLNLDADRAPAPPDTGQEEHASAEQPTERPNASAPPATR